MYSYILVILSSSQQYAQMKFQVCRGILFIEPPECPRNATTCVKRSQLVNYYNELVIQLRIAERLLNTRITTEILEEKRNEVEKNETKIIELLRGSILPLLNIAVSLASHLYSIYNLSLCSIKIM